jgi:hypothetical protein
VCFHFHHHRVCLDVDDLVAQWSPPGDPPFRGVDEVEAAISDLRVLATVDRVGRYAGDDLRRELHDVASERVAAISTMLGEKYGIEVGGPAEVGSGVG